MKDYFANNRTLVDLIPSHLRDETNTSVMENLFDRFFTQEESVPLFGYIGKNTVGDEIAKIPELDDSRSINQLVSTYVFANGTEKQFYTPNDFLLKLKDLGVRDVQEWLCSKSNNYVPPITLDKFVNFYDYFWVGKDPRIKNTPVWNASRSPEYYVIAKPAKTETTKLNVLAATTEMIALTGSGYFDLNFKIKFTSPTNLIITAVGNTYGFSQGNVTQSFSLQPIPEISTTQGENRNIIDTIVFANDADVLATFTFTREFVQTDELDFYQTFFENDEFDVNARFIDSNSFISFNGSVGDTQRGGISNVKTRQEYQMIDGVKISAGDRVLVTHGQSPGIYVVSRGEWSKAEDDTLNNGDTVFVKSGSTNGGRIFNVSGGRWVKTTTTKNNTNDWQEGNFWVHKSVFDSPHPYDLSLVEQARRPIIEFWHGLELNSSLSGYSYVQTKTKFNQVPLFNLYRYDGTFTNLVSSIFFYVEDSTADIDLLLQRRVKLTDSADFLFDHGLEDKDGSLMWFKHNGALKTIWAPGVTSSAVKKTAFRGDGTGQISVSVLGQQQQQILSFTYIGDNKFQVISSKYDSLPNPVVIGTEYSNTIFKSTITGTNFSKGDVFLVMIAGLEHTRNVVNSNKLTNSYTNTGEVLYPRMFTHNPLNDNSGELREGTLYGHFRSIKLNQINDAIDYTFGGTIKSWDAPVSLLSSLLMQSDISVPSLINFAKRSYENSLNHLNEIFFSKIFQFLTTAEDFSSGISVSEITDFILDILQKDKNTKTFIDSTSGVEGFPISLAKMGFVPAILPKMIFDGELSTWMIQHHDGHLNPAFRNNEQFQNLLFEKRIRAVYPGLITDFQQTPPAASKGKVWRLSENGENLTKVFCVEVSSPSTPAILDENGEVQWREGDVWYQEGTQNIFRFNTIGNKWKLTNESVSSFWKYINFADILNSIILEVETRLYENVENYTPAVLDPSKWNAQVFTEELRLELASWAFKNKLDPTGSNFEQSNAFTWNYSKAVPTTISRFTATTVPKARWFELLKQHQAAVSNVIPTERPDLYPWQLLGHRTKPSTWGQYESPVQTFVSSKQVNAIAADVLPSAQVFGTRIIDGVMVSAGKLVVVSGNLVASRNGLWTVANGDWERVELDNDTKIIVTGGSTMSGTEWCYINGVLHQVRLWSTKMWEDIKHARPTLKISVNKYNDRLLPPYVNAAIPCSVDALTTTIPPGLTLPYQFGDKSPVESIWMKSMEFNYALAQAWFKYDPLALLKKLWGYSTITVNGVEMETYTRAPFCIKKLDRHGANLSSSNRIDSLKFSGIATGTAVNVEFVMVGVANSKQYFRLDINGVKMGYVVEGITLNSTIGGVKFTNLLINDNGIPFRIGDTFSLEISANAASLQRSFISAPANVVNGLFQIFEQAQREHGVDGRVNNAMYAWEPYIGYRVGGYLIDDENLIVSTSLATIEPHSYSIVSKKTSNFNGSWINALRVSVLKIGANSSRQNNSYTPNSNADDWVFRIDGYNPNSMEIKFHTFNKSGEFNTFNALEKAHTDIDWVQYTEVKEVQTVVLPITIIGLENVVNFLFGYESYLTSIGWDITRPNPKNVDEPTGRYNDVQLAVEKLIDGIYAGSSVGKGNIINPIAHGAYFNHPQGVLASFVKTGMFDPISDPAAYDILGNRIAVEDLQIQRSKEYSLIGANMPIYSIRSEVDIYEHLIVFDRYLDSIRQTGVIYEPFQGAICSFIKFNGRKQASISLRPEIGGYVLANGVLTKNIESSVATVQNMYDANKVYDDKNTSDHALALFGYNKKGYMADMDYTEKTQYNFWRGMIHMKGTNMSFDAFKNGNRFDDAKLDEYWAFRIADYGDARTKVYPDMLIQNDDCQQQFTRFSLNSKLDETFIRVNSDDEARWFSTDDLSKLNEFTTKIMRTHEIVISNSDVTNGTVFNFENTGDFVSHSVNLQKLNHTAFKAISAGLATVTYTNVDIDKHAPLKLIDYVDKETIATIPYWNPIIGFNNPFAMVAVDVQSNNNPAKYNYSTIIDGNTTYEPYRAWGVAEVGMTWWDTTNFKHLPYNDSTKFGSVNDKLNRWGALAEHGSVDVCEWVESSVPPSEYESLSTSTNNNIRTDGIPYGAKYFSRKRIWSMAPIAWSKSGVPSKDAHPSFNGAFNATLNFRSNGITSLSSGTFASHGIVSGMRIGAWRNDPSFTGPLNEFAVISNDTKSFMLDSVEFNQKPLQIDGVAGYVSPFVDIYTDTNGKLEIIFDPIFNITETPLMTFEGIPTGTSTFDVTLDCYINNKKIGKAKVSSKTGPSNMEPTIQIAAGEEYKILLPNGVGLKLSFVDDIEVMGSELASELEQLLVDGVIIEDAIYLEEVVFNGLEPSEVLPFPTNLSNNPDDPIYLANNGCGWRAWTVPTQDDLDSDAEQPASQWKPYIGNYSEVVSMTKTLIDDAISNGTMYLNDGTAISRYQSKWDEWTELKDRIETRVSTGGDVTFEFAESIKDSDLFIYKNGVRQIEGTFLKYGSVIVVPDTTVGDDLYIRIASYLPSEAELKFDPDVADDLKKQIHYKKDYEYVKLPVRNLDGVVIGAKFYFWVTNKTSTANKLPTTTISQMLVSGPPQFIVFPSSKSVVLNGMNYLVGMNNQFKIRLVNDETLRDDLNGLDLKDTHHEWALIRRGQRQKVPKKLWDKIVDSMCGENIVGDAIPSRSRIEYDARNYTNSIYGFADDQVIAPSNILVDTVFFTITNSKVHREFDLSDEIDFISSDVLDWDSSETWFNSPANIRKNMDAIWNNAKSSQINEIVFAAIEDVCVYISEMTHLMKTSRLSAHSIKMVQPMASLEDFE